MKVSESVRKAIRDHEEGDIDSAMMHACNAVDGTAAKVYPQIAGNNERFTRLLRDSNYILEPMAAPGINLEETRFPVRLPRAKAPGGRPDFADVVYGIHRCCHGHGEDLPDGFELERNAGGPYNNVTRMHFDLGEVGKVRISDRTIFGLLAVAVFSPANSDQRVPDGYCLKYGRVTMVINEWWGRAADFPAIAATEVMPRVTLDFQHWFAAMGV
jgi:hypothetical protein